MRQKRAFIFGGAPICGKDTQTDQFERLGAHVLKTGPMLKDAARRNPEGPEARAIASGHLVSDEIVIAASKRWIMRYLGREIIMLNGMPRNVFQMPVIQFLEERGFAPHMIWFTTPVSVCMERDIRPDRPEDAPEIRRTRMEVYTRETLPMQDEFARYGLTENEGNLLCIDNTHLRKENVAAMIISQFDLPYSVADMFPVKAADEQPQRETRQQSDFSGDMVLA